MVILTIHYVVTVKLKSILTGVSAYRKQLINSSQALCSLCVHRIISNIHSVVSLLEACTVGKAV